MANVKVLLLITSFSVELGAVSLDPVAETDSEEDDNNEDDSNNDDDDAMEEETPVDEIKTGGDVLESFSGEESEDGFSSAFEAEFGPSDDEKEDDDVEDDAAEDDAAEDDAVEVRSTSSGVSSILAMINSTQQSLQSVTAEGLSLLSGGTKKRAKPEPEQLRLTNGDDGATDGALIEQDESDDEVEQPKTKRACN